MSIVNEALSMPIWMQFLVVGILILVGQFWFTQFADKISSSNWSKSSWFRLLKNIVAASLISVLAVNYWIGRTPNGMGLAWGFYGRGAFILLTLYLTQFFTRFYTK